MVKVQIPLDDDDGDEVTEPSINGNNGDEVGIMSSSDAESEVDDDIDDPDWDDMKDTNKDEGKLIRSIEMSSLPQNGVTIQLGPPKVRSRRRKGNKVASSDDETNLELTEKPKKKRMTLNEYIRKSVNKVKITTQLMKHKLSLLIYLARGLRLIKVINNNIIKGLSLSVTNNMTKMKGSKSVDIKWLAQFTKQFGDIVSISSDEAKKEEHLNQPFMVNMLDCFRTLEVTTLMENVVMFVACLKAVKPETPIRIINALRPITLIADIIPKPPSPEEITHKTEQNETTKKGNLMKVDKSNQKLNHGCEKIELIDIEDDEPVAEKQDFWVEVYIESDKRWVCVDTCNLEIDEPTVLVELSQPFNYLVSFDVDRMCIKAAEKNYCQNWYTPGFKRNRCEDQWWNSLLEAMGPIKPNDKDVADATKIDEILLNQDMPKSDNGFRNHPLYVLEKHLLKFQGIYPPEVPPLGYFKENPIYPRDCVQTLRSRETWLRQARTVKPYETAYKIVKARPKRDKISGELIHGLPLELFGEWQTKDYEPPEAQDGKVPRNCYGNVDMYQECMLPKGCKWLKLPGLPRVAQKLGLDCAAAVVGFDNHCGSYGAHPVIDGFVVCEEHAETLQLAWEEEQDNIRQREEAKRQKRIWDNWKRLIKATQIRERLRVKYKNS